MRADLRQMGTVRPMLPLLSPDLVESFGRDGAVVLRGVFSDWIETLAAGVAKNEADPGEYFAENVPIRSAVGRSKLVNDAVAKGVGDSRACNRALNALVSRGEFGERHGGKTVFRNM